MTADWEGAQTLAPNDIIQTRLQLWNVGSLFVLWKEVKRSREAVFCFHRAGMIREEEFARLQRQ